MTDRDAWERRLREARDQRDAFFADHEQSPVPPAARESFDGLRYYPPNPDLRFELPLAEHDTRQRRTVETTADREQVYLRWGEFTFTVEGTDCTLQAYKSDPEEDRLWVPFRDETSGETTYGAGRYLDLEAPADRAGDDWVLDFNEAYSPFCAYSDAYECPLVPTENWLAVPIEAGEKAPDLDADGSH